MAILYSSRIDAIHNVFGDMNHTFALKLQQITKFHWYIAKFKCLSFAYTLTHTHAHTHKLNTAMYGTVSRCTTCHHTP